MYVCKSISNKGLFGAISGSQQNGAEIVKSSYIPIAFHTHSLTQYQHPIPDLCIVIISKPRLSQ